MPASSALKGFCGFPGGRSRRPPVEGIISNEGSPFPVPTLQVQRRIDSMMQLARNLWNDDSGQGLAEYALLLGLIVIGVVVFIQGMGGHIKNLFGKANN